MIGTRATALPALLVVAALFAGCKKEVTNEQSTETDPTVDWEASSGDDGGDGSGDTGAEAAMAEDDVQDAGPSLVIVGAAPVEAAAR